MLKSLKSGILPPLLICLIFLLLIGPSPLKTILKHLGYSNNNFTLIRKQMNTDTGSLWHFFKNSGFCWKLWQAEIITFLQWNQKFFIVLMLLKLGPLSVVIGWWKFARIRNSWNQAAEVVSPILEFWNALTPLLFEIMTSNLHY